MDKFFAEIEKRSNSSLKVHSVWIFSKKLIAHWFFAKSAQRIDSSKSVRFFELKTQKTRKTRRFLSPAYQSIQEKELYLYANEPQVIGLSN